jgi:GAF domain-containing protein
VYAYDDALDELVALHAVGSEVTRVIGLRIAIGHRLSGWVAANRRPIHNSDPALDLADRTSSMDHRLQSSLSVPIAAEDLLIGVVSLYSEQPDAFSSSDVAAAQDYVNRSLGRIQRALARKGTLINNGGSHFVSV